MIAAGNSAPELAPPGRSNSPGLRILSVYVPTVDATINAAFDPGSGSYRDLDTLFEVPTEQYQETVRRIARLMDESDAESSAPGFDGTYRLRRGTVSYKQALRIARAGRIDGVVLDAETAAVRCNFPFGLSFAIEYTRARWAGGAERAAVATALVTSLKAGPNSAVQDLLSARLTPTRKASAKSARAEGTLSGDRDGIKASCGFADEELDKLCREIVELRGLVVLPSASVVNVLLEEIGLLEPSAKRRR